MAYIDFLKSKQKEHQPTGFECVETNEYMFDFQKEIAKWSIKKGRAAIFADCGLGKTLMQLEFSKRVAEKTQGKVLILAPLTVTKQTEREGEKFGYSVNICRKHSDVIDGINITNYEMLDHFNADEFNGIVLDESSILKSYMGKTKLEIINRFEKTPYKLSCTATPSPNNHMEILNQAEFLGVMKSHEALAIWFINDTSQSGSYKLKGHAVKSFWEWVSTWAVCISTPSDIGFSDNGYVLPRLNEIETIVKIDEFNNDLRDGMFRVIETNATAFHKEKRLTAKKRAIKCAEIVHSTDEQYVIWCNTDYEADHLKRYIPTAIEIRGSHSPDFKEQTALDFIDGKIRVIISKPKIFGYGINFQNCRNTVFCGLDYSYENYYQAMRRFWRFGQTKEVNAYIVIGSTEKQILDTIRRKERQQEQMKKGMYGNLKDIQTKSIQGTEFKLNFEVPTITMPNWLKGEYA